MNSRKIILKSVSDFDKDVAMISNYTSMSKNIEWPKSADWKAPADKHRKAKGGCY